MGRKVVRENEFLLQVDFCPSRGPDAPFARGDITTKLEVGTTSAGTRHLEAAVRPERHPAINNTSPRQ